jgi:hypothetical protein
VEYIVESCIAMESERRDLAGRQRILKEMDAAGIMATPGNSSFNEQVIEAARESILNGGKTVNIEYAAAK